MIYVVSKQQELLIKTKYEHISIEKSLEIMKDWKYVQYDCETTGLDARLCDVLIAQFGNIEETIQIVVDCTTVSLSEYKEILETKAIIGANLKFDYKFLFNYNIIPTNTYDIMIIEQLIYLSYPKSYIRYSLKAIAERYLNIDIDKSIRSEIPNLGITDSVIEYGANDVVYLYRILQKQIQILQQRGMLKAARVECDFVICCAYYEWCGVRLDVDKWQDNIWGYDEELKTITKLLNDFVVKLGNKDYLTYQFPGLFDLWEPGWQCNINWNSPKQVVPFLQYLGFKTSFYDKKTKKYKDTSSAKIVEKQKDINKEFADLYVKYSDINKLRSTYGYSYINAVNPKTDRIHTEFRAIGTNTGRLACGSKKVNIDLAKYKKLPLVATKDNRDQWCIYVNVQVLPRSEDIRGSFIPKDGNVMISTDYSSQESRFLADLSQDKAMMEEYGPNGGGDMHSLVAKMVYPQLRNLTTKEIKENHKDLRQKAKNPEFCFAYGGNWATLVSEYGMNPDEAKEIDYNYREGFRGVTEYQNKCKSFTANNGFIPICKLTGHKSYVYGWEEWRKNQTSSDFWMKYRQYKDAKQKIPSIYWQHFEFQKQMDKNAVNSTTQGLGAVCFKIFSYRFFKWIVKHGYFNKVLFCVPAHDETVIECPKQNQKEVTKALEYFMMDTAEKLCKSLPMPVESSIGDHWIH